MNFEAKSRRLIGYFLITILLLNLPGCMNRREIDKLGMLGAIGVDIKDEKIFLTMEIAKPSPPEKAKSDTKPEVIIQASGDSFFEAMRNATTKFDRKIFISTSRVIVISEKAARRGIIDLLEFWIRDHEPRGSDFLIIARDCDASEIIGLTGGISDAPYKFLEDLIEANKANSKSIRKMVYQYKKDYYADGLQPTIGVIQKMSKADIGSKEDFELILEGAAVFDRDKFVGCLDGLETRSLNFLTGELSSGIIVSRIPGDQAPNSMEIMKSSNKLDVELQEDGSVLLKAEITIDGMLGEQPGAIDLKDPNVMKKVEESCSQIVKEQLESTIQKTQKDYGLDIFGFGQVVHRKYPQQWKTLKNEWDRIFANSEVIVQVKTNISRSGLLNQPMKRKSE